MASRAPTLTKPKTKPKVTSKSILSKAKTPVALKVTAKPATKTSAKAITISAKPAAKVTATKTAVTKSVVTKPETAKSHPAHTAVAKPKLLKSSAVKPAAVDAKSTAALVAPQPKPRRRAKGEIRTRIYWAVFNTDLRRVAVFEFDQRDEAERRAIKLTESSGEHHFIQKIKAIVQ